MPNPNSTKVSLARKPANNSKAEVSKSSVGPEITATSQTSRFHVDTLTTLSQEVCASGKPLDNYQPNIQVTLRTTSASQIDLHQVNISVGINDLIVDSHLRLKAGVHYAVGVCGSISSHLKLTLNRL